MRLETASTTADRPRQHVPAPVRSRRELSLDILRGLAVVLMVATHAIAFFHVGDDSTINLIGTFGGAASFVLFLFISGVVTYLSFVKYQSTEVEKIASKRRSILYRSVGLLLGYYLVAFVASFSSYSFPPNAAWIESIARTLFFVDIPPFTEFILPFVFLSLLALPLRGFYRFILRYPPFAIAIGLSLYALGQLLYPLAIDGMLVHLKALLVGNGEWHRFPLFQYFIVYILGMVWGKFLANNQDESYRNRIALLATAVSGTLLVLAHISFNYIGGSWLEPLFRWPPSFTFLLIGIITFYVLFLVVNVTNYLKILGPGQVALHFFGVKAFDFFIAHTVILFLYQYITSDQRVTSSLIVTMLYLGLLVASAIAVSIKDWVIDYLKGDQDVDGIGWLWSERVVVTFVWIMIFLLGGMGVFQGRDAVTSIAAEDVSFKKQLIREEEWPFWWDHTFNYFRQIFITDSGSPVFAGTWYSVDFNHAEAVAAGQSLASGADVRVVYYDEQNDFMELPFIFEGIGGQAKLKFKLQNNIQPGVEEDKYFIYYGNQTATAYPASKETPPTSVATNVRVSEVFKHRISGSTNRRWLVKENTVSLQLRTLVFTAKLDASIAPDSLVSYSIEGSSLRGMMDNLGDGNYQASIKIADLPVGTYKIQAVAREQENKLKLIESGYSTFFVTHPLYVVWTQDWEGWDVPDAWLNEIDAFARRFNMPMTHFFNPRIYVTGAINKQRADQLTLWVQNRAKNHNDEIGLHLHMWFDMVRAAGVTPRSTDYAGWLYGDGGGVAAYTYPVEEMKQILTWSRRVFQDNGLPTPLSFRAGGWLSKENTLQALEETGFLIDSSGRTKAGLDPQTSRMKSLLPPWDLSPTQRPYRPNKTNQNSSEAPNFKIWEFPNNGADSIWYTDAEMIHRFDLNYPNKGSILEEAQVLNYLSHPPFWSIDKPRVEKLYGYIDNYSYAADRGPVIYTTLENAYFSWDRD